MINASEARAILNKGVNNYRHFNKERLTAIANKILDGVDLDFWDEKLLRELDRQNWYDIAKDAVKIKGKWRQNNGHGLEDRKIRK